MERKQAKKKKKKKQKAKGKKRNGLWFNIENTRNDDQ